MFFLCKADSQRLRKKQRQQAKQQLAHSRKIVMDAPAIKPVTFQVSESSTGLSPAADEGRQRAEDHDKHATKAGPHSRNSVAAVDMLTAMIERELSERRHMLAQAYDNVHAHTHSNHTQVYNRQHTYLSLIHI